jgi:hypothetical protein
MGVDGVASAFSIVAVSGLITVTALILLSVPVLAPIVRLESLPLVRALQPLFWSDKSGVGPTVDAIDGSARGPGHIRYTREAQGFGTQPSQRSPVRKPRFPVSGFLL